LEPTTYVSQALYNALIGNPSSLLWCLGIIVYAIIFVLLNRFVLRRQ
ncbi:ABC transporter permease, partial [Sulfolobus sp. E3]